MALCIGRPLDDDDPVSPMINRQGFGGFDTRYRYGLAGYACFDSLAGTICTALRDRREGFVFSGCPMVVVGYLASLESEEFKVAIGDAGERVSEALV